MNRVTSPEQRLENIQIDETTIRLDCTPKWLAQNVGRFAIGGVHLATQTDVDHGFKPNAVVPNPPIALTSENVGYLAPFCADSQTPPSMCIGFGELPDGEVIARRVIEEAAAPNFRAYYGSTYKLGGYEGRLAEVLQSEPHMLTTIIQDPQIEHDFDPGADNAVGMHYDNAKRMENGVVEPIEQFPRSIRAEQAARRLLYNAGPGPRKSIISLTMSALYLSDRAKPGDQSNIPNTRQLREYLARHPEEVQCAAYLAVTVDVGEMLLLPAGNAMHDGSMIGCEQESKLVIFSGRFPRFAFQEYINSTVEAL
jgi:hypothetical protein